MTKDEKNFYINIINGLLLDNIISGKQYTKIFKRINKLYKDNDSFIDKYYLYERLKEC